MTYVHVCAACGHWVPITDEGVQEMQRHLNRHRAGGDDPRPEKDVYVERKALR